MKKLKNILMVFVMIFIATSCTNDGGNSKVELIEGAIIDITKTPQTDSSINLINVNNGVPIKLGITVAVSRGNVASMNLIGFYKKAGSPVEKAVLKTNITAFPSNLILNQTDLINAFNILTSPTSFSLTDKLTLTSQITLLDGRVINMYNDNGTINFGSDTLNSTVFNATQDFTISCPLNNAALFNGNYKVVTDQWQDYSVGDTVPVVYNSANGLLKFRVLNTTNPSSLASSSASYLEVTINPVNSTVTLISNGLYAYDNTLANTFTATGVGTITSCTGDINLKVTWKNGLNAVNGTFNFNLVKN